MITENQSRPKNKLHKMMMPRQYIVIIITMESKCFKRKVIALFPEIRHGNHPDILLDETRSCSCPGTRHEYDGLGDKFLKSMKT